MTNLAEWHENAVAQISKPAGTALTVISDTVTADVATTKPDPTLAFYNETCGTCLYMHDAVPDTPNHLQAPFCRQSVPSATGSVWEGEHPRVKPERWACGQWRQNPFLRSSADV